MQSREDRLHVTPPALQEGVEHLALRYTTSVAGLGVFITLEKRNFVAHVGQHLRCAHSGDASTYYQD